MKQKSRIWIYIILIVVTAGLMLLLRNCRDTGFDRGPAESDDDTVRVAIQYAPGTFFMKGDSLGGRDYEILQSLGIPYRIYPITNPSEGLAGLNSGEYDVVIADLPLIADSTSEYIFTEPVYLDRQVLVQRVDSAGAAPEVNSVIQLEGDTVYVAENSPMAARVKNLEAEIGGEITVVERPVTSERLLMELARGEDGIRFAVVNETVAREMSADYPQLNFSVPVSMTQFQPWVLRKNEKALRDRIDKRLKSIGKVN